MDVYVVGFALDSQDRVALIKKNRPQWQAGKLNGIGGHVEDGENPLVAMQREFLEETGLNVGGWTLMVTMQFPGAVIYFYRTRIFDAGMRKIRSTTDEEVGVYDLGFVIQSALLPDGGVIPNLAWLLPLAAYTADEYQPIYVTATLAEAVNGVTS